uniref:F-box protein n=2 Tax=Quercus lobata TaxID=97700 RepID=A0A7N2LD50_QUELO
MASLQASPLTLSSSSKKISAAIHLPKLPRVPLSVPKIPTRTVVEELNIRAGFTKTVPIDVESYNSASIANTQLYALLEAVADRVEMHNNIGKQRDNWNTLLLNSINMITLTAATLTGVGAIGGTGMPLLALKLSSALLYSAATGLLLIMNKIQPSQLAEEQQDVKIVMEKVLALDKAFPLPLLGAMLEKFPSKFEPAVWWPSTQSQNKTRVEEGKFHKMEKNGWSEELEVEMRDIMEVVKRKDIKDYVRLGNLVLKINKILAISGPLLTGIAAVGSTFVGNGSWAAIIAVAAGVLGSVVNTFEHGGQVGMVFEMYRNSAGFFSLLEESIEGTLEEKDLEKRENGELFEMKVALKFGRSLSQLKELARKSAYSRREGTSIDEFASKLF